MNDDRPALTARLSRHVHPGLTLEATLRLGVECGVLFGPSGAGKTSLLRAIAGLSPPDDGHIALGDHVLLDTSRRIRVPMRHRRIGMIFQDDRLFPHLSVARNITFGLHGWPREQAAARRDEVARLCGVTHLLARDPATLSGGERQRVGLARVLAPRPRLLLCDEPVSALDFDARFTLLDQLRTIQRAEAIPLLYVTHSPAEAVALGAKLFLIEAGAIRDEGDPLEVLGRRDALHDELRNIVRGTVAAQAPADGETHLSLGPDGPILIVPHEPADLGTARSVMVRADDILLASGPVAGLSARNRIPGVVERVVPHDAAAEVIVRTGGVVWLASVVASAAAALDLRPGVPVFLVIKARSCRPLFSEPPSEAAGP